MVSDNTEKKEHAHEGIAPPLFPEVIADDGFQHFLILSGIGGLCRDIQMPKSLFFKLTITEFL